MILQGFRYQCSFRRFVDDLERYRHLNKHTIAQHEFLPDWIDYLGAVETLERDWSVLAARFGLPELPMLNATGFEFVPAKKDANRIIDMYRIDYELWRQ